MFFILLLISLAGITLGLLISAAVDNPDRAITLVPVVLMPQIMFSGMNVAIEEMQSWSRFISNFMVVRWSVSLLEKLWMRRLSSAFYNELIILVVFLSTSTARKSDNRITDSFHTLRGSILLSVPQSESLFS